MWLRTILTLAIAGAAGSAAQAQTFQMRNYSYTAQTAAASRMQGDVVAGGITWACQGSVCSTTGPWPRPAPQACRALADQVGRVTAYGHSGAMLSAGELATCNAGQAAQAQVLTPQVAAPPVLRAPLIPMRRGPITTPEISLVGGAIAAPAARAPTLVVTTSELSLVGGSIAAPTPRAATVVVDTAELSLVGR